ncbi:MAG TPA: hypothetical protein VGH73_25105 [Thermoanaerobaculia bacterium]|jgi:hypothetical protein
MKTWLVVVVAWIVAATSAYAQESDPCAEVLRIGLHDSLQTSYQSDDRKAVFDFLCKEDSNSTLASIDTAASIPIPQLKGIIGGNFDAKKVEDWRSSSCATRNEQFSQQEASTFLSSALSRFAPNAIEAWKACRQDSTNYSSSPAAATITEYDGTDFTLRIHYQPVGTTAVRIDQFMQTNVNCHWSPTKNTVFELDKILNCTRGEKRVAIQMAFTNAQPMRPVVLPKKSPRVRTCDEQEHCTGKVIACQHVGDDSDGVTHLNYTVDGKWVVTYGTWANSQCKTGGGGWHQAAGTCGTGEGAGYKRCGSVRVIPDQE